MISINTVDSKAAWKTIEVLIKFLIILALNIENTRRVYFDIMLTRHVFKNAGLICNPNSKSLDLMVSGFYIFVVHVISLGIAMTNYLAGNTYLIRLIKGMTLRN